MVVERGGGVMSTATQRVSRTNMFAPYLFVTNMFATLAE